MWQDIRVALRGFRSAPAFTVTALVTLTLAIGANATIFSLVHALVLREANVRDPQSLVQVSSLVPPRNFENWLTYAIYDDFKQRQQVFSTVIGWRANDVLNIEGGGQRSRGLVATVSGNFFDELGARPALGRLLAADDLAEPSPDPAMVAVLGHAYWQRVFAGDPAAVGRRVVIEGVPLEIIGVAPPDFRGLSLFTEPDVTVPLTAYPRLAGHAAGSLMSSASAWVRTTGRLAPGVSIDQARAGINLLWRDLRAAHIPPSLDGARRDAFLAAGVSVRSAAYGLEAGPGLRERFTRPLILLLAIALLVLVIACLNLASLMVARGVAAGHAIAVRLALGAARFRVMRAIVIEGILLAIGGGLAGLLAAMWVSDALARLLLEDFVIPASLDVQPDLRVIGFTSLLILGGGSVCSLVAAWRASRQDVIVALRHDTRTSTGRRHAGRWLIAAEVSISLMLLVHSGLLVRSLQSVLAVPSGMDATDVVVAYPQPHAGGYRDVDNDTYFQSLVNRLEQMPGVQRAAVANFKPAGGGIGFGERVAALNAPETDGALATFMSVSPQLFDVLRMPIIDGRDFTWNDVSQSRRVAVVSETLARQVFSDRSAIGQRVRIGMLPHRQDVEIVGVVADAHIYDLKDPNLAGIYVASLQEPNLVDGKCVVVRGTGVSLASIDAALAPLGYETVARMETLEHIVDRVLLQDRLSAMFASFFGVIALLLAAIGVYGLMSFEVQQRGRETAIRVALGASRRDVLTTTAGRAAGVTMAGLAIGALLAAGSVEALRALIFGISPYDAVTLLIAVAVLSTVAGIASLLPAWRAAKTDPASVLRTT